MTTFIAFIIGCCCFRQRALVRRLRRENAELRGERDGQCVRIVMLEHAFRELAEVSSSQLIEIVELESRCDALSNPVRRLDLGQPIYN